MYDVDWHSCHRTEGQGLCHCSTGFVRRSGSGRHCQICNSYSRDMRIHCAHSTSALHTQTMTFSPATLPRTKDAVCKDHACATKGAVQSSCCDILPDLDLPSLCYCVPRVRVRLLKQLSTLLQTRAVLVTHKAVWWWS